MNRKIILSVIIAFIVSFSLLFIFLYSFPDSIQYRENKFYSSNLDPKINKIFLLGSSHVGELNVTLINQYVSKEHPNYLVYNLAHDGDTPTERLKTLKKIISLKPMIIFYGVSYRDFDGLPSTKILPDPQTLLYKTHFFEDLQSVFDLPNPKLITLVMSQDIRHPNFTKNFFLGTPNAVFIPNTPFFAYLPSDRRVSTYDQLKSESSISEASTVNIDPSSTNQEVWAMKEIIKQLHEKNIKIVVFTTPQYKIYNDAIPPSQKENFNSLLQNLKQQNVKIYDFTEKYSDLLIFINPSHVAFNKTSSIYSEDIAKIIIGELSS